MKLEGSISRHRGAEILIVEDSPVQAQSLENLLTLKGYKVFWAKDGAEGLSMTREKRPAIVISNILMPGINGFEMCYAIKHDKALKNIPVLLLITLSAMEDIVHGLNAQADNYIIKPYDNDSLLFRIERLLSAQEERPRNRAVQPFDFYFNAKKYQINAPPQVILDFLISTYENTIQQNHSLTRLDKELRVLNAELKDKVKELDTFSYSVSHDLRAPLTAINGFSQALLEDQADRLDAEGKEHLQRISAAAIKMGQLIGGLLALSRLTRIETTHSVVDLSALVKAISADLEKGEPDRVVAFNIAEGVIAYGDKPLLKVVMENLLRNAWKFTMKKPQARIEFGCEDTNGKRINYVRDNGAGFDMAYVDKLFGPFQRLHGATEFPGTGIGLATVQRIIHRHGGRIWAKGAVDQGATFYFTL